MIRVGCAGRILGFSIPYFVTVITLSVFASTVGWGNGGDPPPDNGPAVLWINAGDGQTDSTWSAVGGTGSIYNEMKGGFSHWAGFLEAMGFENSQEVESQIVLSAALLEPYDYVVFAFTARAYTAEETAALADWVAGGGRVLVIGSFALGHSDNPFNNTILAPFGIQFGAREQTRLLELTDFSPHPITENVHLVQSDVADYLDVTEGVEVLARYKDQPALALASHGEGEVLAFWDCNCFFNGVYPAWDLPCIHDADNQTFAENIFKYFRWEGEGYVPPPTATPTPVPGEPVPLLSLRFEGTLFGDDGETPFKVQNVGYFPAPEGEGVRVLEDGTLQYAVEDNINPAGGLVDVWIQRKWDDSPLSHFIVLAGTHAENCIEMNKDQQGYLRWSAVRDGQGCEVNVSINDWEMDSWHHIQGYWGAEAVSLYIDGEFAGKNDRGGTYRPPEVLEAPILIGCHPEVGALWSDMVFDSVKVYGPEVVPPAEPTPTPTITPTPIPTEPPTPTPTPTVPLPTIDLVAHIEPAEAKTLDDLECVAEVVDFEGYQGFDYAYRWFRDGVELIEPLSVGGDVFEATGPVLSHHFTAKNQEFFCVVRATAWETGGAVWAQTRTDPVMIVNTSPSEPEIVLLPEDPTPDDGLAVWMIGGATDPDGDPVGLVIEWFESMDGETWTRREELSGRLDPYDRGEPEVSSLYTQMAEFWRVTVTATELSAPAKMDEAGAFKVDAAISVLAAGGSVSRQVFILPDATGDNVVDVRDLAVLRSLWHRPKAELAPEESILFFEPGAPGSREVGPMDLFRFACMGWHR